MGRWAAVNAMAGDVAGLRSAYAIHGPSTTYRIDVLRHVLVQTQINRKSMNCSTIFIYLSLAYPVYYLRLNLYSVSVLVTHQLVTRCKLKRVEHKQSLDTRGGADRARHIPTARPGFDPAVDVPLHYPLSVLLKEKYGTQGKSSFSSILTREQDLVLNMRFRTTCAK